MDEPTSNIQRIFRIEVRVGPKGSETILPLYSSALEADVACPGNLIFTPETPLRYHYADGVSFLAEKMSVPGEFIAGWQQGVLLDRREAPPVEAAPEVPPSPQPAAPSTEPFWRQVVCKMRSARSSLKRG